MTRYTKFTSSFTALTLGAMMIAQPAGAKEKKAKPDYNRSVESVHQPVVTNAVYVFDVQDGGGLSYAEGDRLVGWLNALDVGYGDRLALVGGGYGSSATRSDIAAILSRRGLALGTDTTAIGGEPPAGAVRIVLYRVTARVPGCPDWSDTAETRLSAGMSRNYGCAVNSNFAAMIANPNDLIRGETTDSILRTDTSSNAIKAYRQKAAGAGGQ